MYRYIALAWNTLITDSDSLANSLAQRLKLELSEWICAHETQGLRVYQTDGRASVSKAYPLGCDGGVVLGTVFTRDVAADFKPCQVTFNDREAEKVRSSEGRHLIEHYWGRYVALVKENCGPRVWILRDPTGAMPCFITRFQGVDVICSHIDDCAAMGLIACGINWDHVAAYLWYDHLITAHTGLVGVQRIQAGECVTIGTDSTESTYYWSPDRIYGRRILEDRHQAMRELRNVIQNCVSAWASCYDNILHELSGGLDSAVVLACLSRAPGSLNIVCENHFTPNAEGDERAFARKAARSAGIELVETPIRSSSNPLLSSMFEATKVATPSMTAFVPETQPSRDKLVKTRGIDAVFSGQGGDHLFQSIKTRQIAAEYAWRHGLRGEIFRVISDTSRFTRKSIWSVIKAVVATGLLRKHKDPYEMVKPPPLVSDATRDAVAPSEFRHPWVDTAEHLPGSKRRQIFDIIDTQIFYQLPGHNADIVHPLISQPIIELCLQIPTYVLTYGGIDRALVRGSFEGVVPIDILRRTTKGATTGYFNNLLIRNLPFLREFLLDGILVAKGVLDKQKTEAVLSESSLIRSSNLLFPVLDAVRAEFWVRTWISTEQRAVA